MSDLFFNKIAAAGLAAALGFIGINKMANVAVHADIPDVPAYSKYVPGDSAEVKDVPAPFPQAEWIAGIDATKGAKVFKKCTSCHNADAGGKNGTGPALWNVVGRAAATGADFGYSPAMKSAGLTWNYAELDAYLTNPKAYVPKTKMAFIGVKKPADRAAVIEYLRLRSDAPVAALTEAAPIPGQETEATEIVEEVVEGLIATPEVMEGPEGEVIQDFVAPEIVEEVIEEVVPETEPDHTPENTGDEH
jgi:cytochrome c